MREDSFALTALDLRVMARLCRRRSAKEPHKLLRGLGIPPDQLGLIEDRLLRARLIMAQGDAWAPTPLGNIVAEAIDTTRYWHYFTLCALVCILLAVLILLAMLRASVLPASPL